MMVKLTYEEACDKIDAKVGAGYIFAGVLAEEIANLKLKGEVKKDVIAYYSQQTGISQRELSRMVKGR